MPEGREHRRDDVLGDLLLQRGLEARVVLRREHDGVDPHRAVAVVPDGHLGLAVRPQPGARCPACARARAARRAGGRPRSAAAAATASRRSRSRTSAPGRPRPARPAGRGRCRPGASPSALSTPAAMSGDCAPIDTEMPHESPSNPIGGRRVADAPDDLAHELRDLDVRARGDLAGDVHQAGRHHRLDGDPRGAGPARGSRRGWRPRSGRRSCRGDPRSPTRR